MERDVDFRIDMTNIERLIRLSGLYQVESLGREISGFLSTRLPDVELFILTYNYGVEDYPKRHWDWALSHMEELLDAGLVERLCASKVRLRARSS